MSMPQLSLLPPGSLRINKKDKYLCKNSVYGCQERFRLVSSKLIHEQVHCKYKQPEIIYKLCERCRKESVFSSCHLCETCRREGIRNEKEQRKKKYKEKKNVA